MFHLFVKKTRSKIVAQEALKAYSSVLTKGTPKSLQKAPYISYRVSINIKKTNSTVRCVYLIKPAIIKKNHQSSSDKADASIRGTFCLYTISFIYM